MMVEKPKRAGRVSRAVDAVAEWLFPDPTAYVEEALREFRTRSDQGKRGPEEKSSKKG